MSYILNWHVAGQDLESAVELLSDLAPWGWEELTTQEGFVLRIHLNERKQLKQLQRRIHKTQPEARLETGKEKDADWQTAWQFFFQPVEVAKTFCILPPWKVEENRSDSLIPLVIHPQMAFGTGHHPTTNLCLRAMVHVKGLGRWPEGEAVLDVGTGSGILAIAAARMGTCCVALDIDPVAMDNARENVQANGVDNQVCLFCGEVACLGPDRRYPLVVANILAGPLIRMAPALAGLVQPGGTLILSGVLISQVDSVSRAYEVQGLGKPEIEHLGEWASLMWTGGYPA
ncbi:MAG: 50S ribosomal protein L11 methyltransferase [Desulfovermiculus sp.]|nr:50S ribosomal protein L11 methyltransferase [Desulfovermiculus sp.]